jgi:hypothetical protein
MLRKGSIAEFTTRASLLLPRSESIDDYSVTAVVPLRVDGHYTMISLRKREPTCPFARHRASLDAVPDVLRHALNMAGLGFRSVDM